MNALNRTNNEELHMLMSEHRLGRRDVARLAEYPIARNGQASAVNNWLASSIMASNYRAMPDSALALIKLRLSLLTDEERAALEGPLDKVAIIAANRLKRKCHQPGYVYGTPRGVTKTSKAGNLRSVDLTPLHAGRGQYPQEQRETADTRSGE